MLRTHTCGEITEKLLGKEVTLAGWVNSTRDHGGVIFIDLRDRYGITQIKLDPETTPKNLMDLAQTLRNEYVINVTGKVEMRPEGTFNENLVTGKIEIVPNDLVLINKSEVLPFEVANEHNVREEVRMEYRYLDLRRQRMQQNVIARSKLITTFIQEFTKRDFTYIETPMLLKNTPEGAREFIVPARKSVGKGYVLPQSPQQIKQLLMVAGLDKYFQFAKCFRDEDLRGDRQPEFTQIDIEMSFIQQEDIISMIEEIYTDVVKSLYPQKKFLWEPFKRMYFDEAMNNYGIDKPELRTDELKLVDVSEICSKSELKVFGDVVNGGGVVKAIVADKIYTRGAIDKFTALLQEKGAKGLAYIIWDEEGPKSPILKFFNEDLQKQLFEKLGAKKGTTTFFQATDRLGATEMLGYLRTLLIEDMKLLEGKEDELAFEWVLDFPMFEIDTDTGELAAKHHPFTKPKDEDIPYIINLAKEIRNGYKLTQDDFKKIMNIKADAYDLVLNGYEIGGGSIRITDPILQEAIFTLLGLSQEQIQERFGHMITAYKYGAPTHGGIAMGFDRFVMIIQGEPNIREVIAFPKTQKGEDLLLKTPSEIDPKLLKELGLKKIKE